MNTILQIIENSLEKIKSIALDGLHNDGHKQWYLEEIYLLLADPEAERNWDEATPA